jgi:hypothetical protein
MKSCPNCQRPIADDAGYCTACNTAQHNQLAKKPDDTFLRILCLFTIVTSALGILSTAITFPSIFTLKGSVQLMLIISIFLVTGKLTGGIQMLQKRRNGLYIYTVSTILSILISLYTLTGLATTGGSKEMMNIVGTLVGIGFSIIFLILFWLKVNRKHLS